MSGESLPRYSPAFLELLNAIRQEVAHNKKVDAPNSGSYSTFRSAQSNPNQLLDCFWGAEALEPFEWQDADGNTHSTHRIADVGLAKGEDESEEGEGGQYMLTSDGLVVDTEAKPPKIADDDKILWLARLITGL